MDSAAKTAAPQPLAGITVLDLTLALAGPYATFLLAGLGARVIKIENPAAPDPSRENSPFIGAKGFRFVARSGRHIGIRAQPVTGQVRRNP